jgi:glycosyltransferase involved in cell wall biosynthesis
MHVLYILTILFAWLLALAWAQRALAAARNLPRIPNLLDPRYNQPSPEPARPQLTVIVPARNEAAAIEATLRSLLAQTLPIEILAVDDRSTDPTGVLMDQIAAEPQGPEVRSPAKFLSVIHIQSLPAGWMGKNHAMALAARQTATPWLLFTDGDVLFQPDTLERALAYAQESTTDHVVLLPTLILKTPGERMMSAVFQSLTLLTWRPWKIADPNAKRESIGMGAFNLIRTEVYRATGGFEAQPMEVLEDLRLGFEVKSRGYRQHMVLGPGLIQLHWAAGAIGMVRNLTKNIFATFRFRIHLLLAAWLGLLLVCFAPLAGLFAAWPIRSASLVSLLMIAMLYRLAARYYNHISPLYALTFPIAAALVLYAMLRSTILTLVRRGIVWRGTFYPLSELRRNAGPLR